jgi:uncharacterized protein YcnI
MRSKLYVSVAAAALVVLAVAPSAQAHVTLKPESVPAGGFTRLDVRVPNERDDAATEKVEVQMPDGFFFVSYEPVDGWSVDVKTEKLDEPAEVFGEEQTEQVDTVTFSADDPSAAIQPGQFRDFGLSVGMPDSAEEGDVLTFPSIQTYDSGEVVRWIGEPDADEPAPQVTLTASEEAEHGHDDEAADTEADAAASEDEDDDGAPMGLAVAGLALGALGFVTGGLALRRK